MKISDLLSASPDAEIGIVNGELYIYKPAEPQIEYKFNIGDKVTFKGSAIPYTVTDRFVAGKDCPAYKLDDCENVEEDKIELYVSQDVMPQEGRSRIKTFKDACKWCRENGNGHLVYEHDIFLGDDKLVRPRLFADLIAYLKLRIITCALNEGWEPKFDGEETRYCPYSFIDVDKYSVDFEVSTATFPATLCFKSPKLALYASNQFADIYRDFLHPQKSDN